MRLFSLVCPWEVFTFTAWGIETRAIFCPTNPCLCSASFPFLSFVTFLTCNYSSSLPWFLGRFCSPSSQLHVFKWHSLCSKKLLPKNSLGSKNDGLIQAIHSWPSYSLSLSLQKDLIFNRAGHQRKQRKRSIHGLGCLFFSLVDHEMMQNNNSCSLVVVVDKNCLEWTACVWFINSSLTLSSKRVIIKEGV